MGSVVWAGVQRDWFLDVNGWSRVTPWLHTPARYFAEYGVVLFAALLVLSWWRARYRHDAEPVAAALLAPVAVLLALGANQFIAAAVDEPRPYRALRHVLVLVPRTTDTSFPSDHAVMAGAVAVGVLIVDRRLGVVATLLALLMAATRVYVGAHFPLDVLAGLAVGGAVALVGSFVPRVPTVWIVERLSRGRARALVAAP